MWDHYDLFRPPNNTQTNLSNILSFRILLKPKTKCLQSKTTLLSKHKLFALFTFPYKSQTLSKQGEF